MSYKLSNAANKVELESEFSASLLHPELFQSQLVINGLEESTILTIMPKKTSVLTPAIWGLLPENYEDDWSKFQYLTNSLYVEEQNCKDDIWWKDAYENRRCLVAVTGFYCNNIDSRGKISTYHMSARNKKPFLIAGIFNRTSDDFITCAVLLKEIDQALRETDNLSRQMPVIIKETMKNQWLDSDTSEPEIHQLVSGSNSLQLSSSAISSEFFMQNISYDSMFDSFDEDDMNDSDRL